MIKTLHYFKTITLLIVSCFLFSNTSIAQTTDTLAIQDFELTPQAPTWNYTGTPSAFLSGNSSTTATPANSPIGIGTSRAWHTVSVSGGNPIEFNNQIIPAGYDSIRVTFKLAAMNLNGTTGGPDDLDYVLLSYSTDSGTTFTDRIRVRGAVNNNCSWPYTAAKTANSFYLPAAEALFQPTNSGLQIADGYSTVELVFPGSINQISVKITPRSSSSSDSWLIDNLVLTGEKQCTSSSSIINPVACGSYTSPSGNYIWTTSNTYTDTIPNASNCDSIITVNLTVNNVDTSVILTNDSIYANALSASYQWIDCSNNTVISGATNQSYIASSNGNYAVVVTQNGCTDTSSCVNVTGVSIGELLSNNNINMYPNPVSDILTIELKDNMQDVTLNITNISGQLIYNNSTILNNKEVINLSNLSSGVYFINLTTNGISKHLKFIKN